MSDWPVNPNRITLRVCADMDWKVYLGCPRCRYTTMIWPSKFAEGKLGSTPIHELLARQAFKCRAIERGCDGTPADSVDVLAMNIGQSQTIAKWQRS